MLIKPKNTAMNYPKIGIRPTIDGREGGVRESLERQVMNMTKSAADFLSEKLRYPNGEPIECVIADLCIGGVAEAAATVSKFEKEGVGVSLTVTPAWFQDAGDTSIPEDVQEKLLRFVKAGLAIAIMKGKSYLSMGAVSMGIAGSIVDAAFFQEYLGMRNEYIDMTKFLRNH